MLIITTDTRSKIISTVANIGFVPDVFNEPKTLDEFCKQKKKRVILTDLCFVDSFAVNSDCKIIKIGLIKEGDTSEQKRLAMNCGFSGFLREDSDECEIQILFQQTGIFRTFEEQIIFDISNENGLLNQMSVPVFVKDKNSVFKACNDAFCKYLGYSRDEIFGKTSETFSPKRKAQIYEEVDRLVTETGKSRAYEGIVSYSGDSLNSSIIQKSPLFDYNGDVYGILGVITDISDRKKKEKELKSAIKKAEEQDKLKSSFLSNMSHEIRTPMNAIVGFSQLLSMPNLPDEKKQIYIEQVNSNAEILLQLIEDIIEVSKIEAGKIQIRKSVCFVNQMLDELYTTFETHRARLMKTHIGLHLKKGHSSPEFNTITDSHRLTQILTNLLGNALKFTEEGMVEFGYTLINDSENHFIKFYVKDTGLGINKEKMVYVFDRFSKIPAGKTKLYGGTGLGLSISKSLTELLGGQIHVESEENVGSVFSFTIPLISENTENTVIKINSNRNVNVSKQYFWHDKTVLIAEDEEMNFLYLKEVLRETKAQVIWKPNGKEAVSEFSSNPKIDIVLMDIKMPQMDGYEATELIRKVNSKIPIIIQTAYAMPAEKKKGFDCGCNEYIEKPIKQKDLLSLIDKYFSAQNTKH